MNLKNLLVEVKGGVSKWRMVVGMGMGMGMGMEVVAIKRKRGRRWVVLLFRCY
jgi:hypothetical protein